MKFELCSKYYKWNAIDGACFLQAALVGPASDVLSDLDVTADDVQVIELLRKRFGSTNSAA